MYGVEPNDCGADDSITHSTAFQAPSMLLSEFQFLGWLNRETNSLYRVIICAIPSVHFFTESRHRPYLSTDDDLHPFRNHHA